MTTPIGRPVAVPTTPVPPPAPAPRDWLTRVAVFLSALSIAITAFVRDFKAEPAPAAVVVQAPAQPPAPDPRSALLDETDRRAWAAYRSWAAAGHPEDLARDAYAKTWRGAIDQLKPTAPEAPQ